MSLPSRLRTPNPHLGAYYGIVTSAFVSLIIILAMFEQLGWGRTLLAQSMMIVPLALYLVIAIGSRTTEVEDYFASGRRVPAVYNGFALAAIAVGGVGFLGYTGTVFFLGFDALAIGLGWTFGMLLAAILFVPYLRKAGSYTLPSFLGHRFRSRTLRMAASVMQLAPAALLVVAEIKIAALIASLFLPVAFSIAVLMLSALIAAIAILGGMRSLTWTASAEFIVGAVGLVVVVTTVSILLTNLPAPQLTYGEMFSSLQNAEITAGLTPVAPGGLATALPGTPPHPNVKPFLQSFGILAPMDFATLFLCLALGTAALPSLLMRSGVTSSIGEQRRSTAWGLLFVALFVMTAPAMAAFAKLIIFRDIALAPASSLPGWLIELGDKGLLQVHDANGDGAIGAAELFIGRDGIALALPSAAGLPYVLTVLMATAAMALALAAAAAHLFTLAASLAEDLYRVLDGRQTLPRLIAAWAAIAASALAAAVFLLIADLDPLKAALTAFAFAAATFFPALLLATWWRRCTKWGAFAAMTVGFTVMLGETVLGGVFGFANAGFTTSVASLAGILLALAVGVAVSLYLRKPSPAEDNYFDDMRDPEGETIYDRAQARAAAQAAAQAAAAEATPVQ
ncbi:MAG TPA: VC_2705 family sodium/solute symporter [Methyloceanibacter sp.]|jgi:cation/acetate symporter|nr:VC_2705 family sodium/solute symporter [Methyloceanibacter sp.]